MSCHHSSVSNLLAAATRIALIGLIVSVATVAVGDTITVCGDGSGDYLTIQEGIDAAVDGDEVVVCDGVYTGPGNKNLDFGGKAITVRSANGPENCTIDCEGDGRGFYFRSGETADAVVDGITIVRAGPDHRGAIRCDGSGPTIANCVVSACDDQGIACTYSSNPIITNCVITDNSGGYGAGIHAYVNCNLTITDCVIARNGGPGPGGGIYCSESVLTLERCTVVDNTADYGGGGGIFCELSSVNIVNCTIARNAATWQYDSDQGGGGLALILCESRITDCTIADNLMNSGWAYGEVPGGGAIYCRESGSLIERCTINGNLVSGREARGGAFFDRIGSNLTIRDCQIAHNAAEGGVAAAGAFWLGSGTDLTMTECTVLGNVASADYAAAGGAFFCYPLCRLAISNSAVTGNIAVGGSGARAGAFFLQRDEVWLTNCVISENVAAGEAGVVYCAMSSDVHLANCTLARNSSAVGRTLVCTSSFGHTSRVRIRNTVIWNGGDEIQNDDGSSISVTYSDIQGGWPGYGNIDADPMFVDSDGGDYHLAAGSPCIDAGCNGSVPADFADLDDDGDTSEITPLDLDGEGRFFDDPDTDDTGGGVPPIVDMGAYEFGGTGPQPCVGDLDGDRVVGEIDLGILLAAWHGSDAGDLNCDGETDQSDLGILLSHWGAICP